MSLSCLKNVSMLSFAQLFCYVLKYAGNNADEECVEKRHKTLERRGGVLSPPGEVDHFDLGKKGFIYSGRLCLRSLFHKVNKGLSSR